MQTRKLQEALENLKAAIQEVERVVEELHAEKDPLAVHIFVSRRNYRKVNDTKAANGTICRLGSVGSRRVILGFAGASKNGNGF